MTVDAITADARVTRRWAAAPDLTGDAVVYWMQRAQRAVDNPALDLAVALGNELGKPVVVFFGLNPFVVRGNLRHYQFLAEGLADIERGLRTRHVGFVVRRYPDHRLLAFLNEVRPVMLVGDESPLRQTEAWRETIATTVGVPFFTVDADVVVPAALIMGEQFAARTIRPRLRRHLDEWLLESPDARATVEWQPASPVQSMAADTRILELLPLDTSARPVDTFVGGTTEARRHLKTFIASRLERYPEERNHPEQAGTSELSPYLHFGHIGPREVALAVRNSGGSPEAIETFLEQLIVRRELSVNFVRHNADYDSIAGCEPWARQTLARHERDSRPARYGRQQLEAAETGDPLWNAGQRQMVVTGWMHNYVRMYWGKKILEWSATAGDAFETAVWLNDRYLIDGRDPNSYAGIAWAVGGKHDRPWPGRPVFGTVRSMTLASTRRKFDADRYIAQWTSARLF
jgi:deoxyribodipyrimidine photo-lyase